MGGPPTIASPVGAGCTTSPDRDAADIPARPTYGAVGGPTAGGSQGSFPSAAGGGGGGSFPSGSAGWAGGSGGSGGGIPAGAAGGSGQAPSSFEKGGEHTPVKGMSEGMGGAAQCPSAGPVHVR
jgi:translation initiation factor IF-2